MPMADFRRCGNKMLKGVSIVALVVMVCALKSNTIERLVFMLTKPAPAAATESPAPRQQQQSDYGSRTVTLRNDGHGHFQVEARVEGRSIDFLVDTGASMIAL